ncbi:UPF0262 family protein [Sandaracinobacteroides saxicola]|uniref:UPF0262 protein H3309_02830 n=1 Tax=Sandaracinobacteroides saxicola TaxID=2759707 RepID=A0A7G5IJB3_9SPHN|nr:UPF0262 family protein [Sandaracinobacteroides saxicola]QMW23455.1 UPF0262 family protein [Sandaracinobacteroides saxicola]
MTADHRIIAVELDERTVLWRNADVEQERRVAIFDLLEGNSFRPLGDSFAAATGPYRLVLRVEEGRLAMDISDAAGVPIDTLVLMLSPFRRVVREYFAICDSYYKAIRQATPSQIETVDMARRGIHNDAATLLMERLEGKAEVDFDTARRLFTLICVLHIRQ